MKKKSKGFRITVIVTAIVLAASFISTICFGAAIGSDVFAHVFRGDSSLAEYINRFTVRDRKGNTLSYADFADLFEDTNLVGKEEKIFSVNSDTVTVNAPVAEISITLSPDDAVHAAFYKYEKGGANNTFTLEERSGVFTIAAAQDAVHGAIGARLELAVPEHLIKTLKISLQAGTLEIEGLKLDRLEIDNEISEILIADTEVRQASVRNKSGRTQLEENFLYTEALTVQTEVGAVAVPVPRSKGISLTYETSIGALETDGLSLDGFLLSNERNVTRCTGTLSSRAAGEKEIQCSIVVEIGNIELYNGI